MRDGHRDARRRHAPTGSITFTLYGPTGSKLDTETVSVHGNGNYTTPRGYALSAGATPGVYQWDATYTGDGSNRSATDNNDPSEQVMVVTPCCNLQGVEFDVYNSGGQFVGEYSDLRGNTQQGDTVKVSFTVPSGHYDELSLASYTAPESFFESDDADLQVVSQFDDRILRAGQVHRRPLGHAAEQLLPGGFRLRVGHRDPGAQRE